MAKDTVERIREVELEARRIKEEAAARAREIEENAAQQAQEAYDEAVAMAQKASAEAMEASRLGGERLSQTSHAKHEQQCAELRKSCEPRRREAVEAVIKRLTGKN